MAPQLTYPFIELSLISWSNECNKLHEPWWLKIICFLVIALQSWDRKTLSIKKGPKSFIFHSKKTLLLDQNFSNVSCVSRSEHGMHSGNSLPLKIFHQPQVSWSLLPLHSTTCSMIESVGQLPQLTNSISTYSNFIAAEVVIESCSVDKTLKNTCEEIHLTLIWLGFLGVRFRWGGGLEIWYINTYKCVVLKINFFGKIVLYSKQCCESCVRDLLVQFSVFVR